MDYIGAFICIWSTSSLIWIVWYIVDGLLLDIHILWLTKVSENLIQVSDMYI